MKDELGDRIKLYESLAGPRLMPTLPIIARMDGIRFHAFTRGMARPFDTEFAACMLYTTTELVKATGANIGYTQSDEITLAWHNPDFKSQIWFGGRTAKMNSVLAAKATLFFYRAVVDIMPKYANRLPTFDARVYNVPDRMEGANTFLWREMDATKNSVNMAASALYSHKELQGKSRSERHDMLYAKGINWNDYPANSKRGSYVQRRKVRTPFTLTEISKLPAKHAARANPFLCKERSVCEPIYMPPIFSVVNRAAVIFDGAAPLKSV